jgi:hypothetical protein
MRYGKQIITKQEYSQKYYQITQIYLDITVVFLGYQNLKDRQLEQLYSKMCLIAILFKHQLDFTIVLLRRKISLSLPKNGYLWYYISYLGKNDRVEYKRLYRYAER